MLQSQDPSYTYVPTRITLVTFIYGNSDENSGSFSSVQVVFLEGHASNGQDFVIDQEFGSSVDVPKAIFAVKYRIKQN